MFWNILIPKYLDKQKEFIHMLLLFFFLLWQIACLRINKNKCLKSEESLCLYLNSNDMNVKYYFIYLDLKYNSRKTTICCHWLWNGGGGKKQSRVCILGPAFSLLIQWKACQLFCYRLQLQPGGHVMFEKPHWDTAFTPLKTA